MTRLGCFGGILLIGVAVVAMVGLILLPTFAEPENNDQATQWLETLLCKPNETYTQKYSTVIDSSGERTNTSMYCVDEAGELRNVTGRMILITGGAFVVPFLLGLGLTMYAKTRTVRGRVQTYISGAQVVTKPGGKQKRVATGQGQWNVGGTQIAVDPYSGEVQINGQTVHAMDTSNTATLSGRLQELEDALENGLISRIEYDRARQRILDDEVS